MATNELLKWLSGVQNNFSVYSEQRMETLFVHRTVKFHFKGQTGNKDKNVQSSKTWPQH